MILISEYLEAYQPDIDKMMMRIQQEFSETITTKHSTVIKDVYQLPMQKYWVALHEDTVVGTIGMVAYGGKAAVVKRMMVDPAYRGKIHGTAQKLLDTGHQWALEQGRSEIYLCTMTQFSAAQKFYEKNGYTAIEKNDLPEDYTSNPMDTLFYKLKLVP